VSSVTSWGFYVTLHNTVELVHVRTLAGEYLFDAAHYTLRSAVGSRAVRLGDAVRVRVEGVGADEIDFALVGRPGKVRV